MSLFLIFCLTELVFLRRGNDQTAILLALMSVLSESLLALVSSHLVSLVLLTVGHNFKVLLVNNSIVFLFFCVFPHIFGVQKYNIFFRSERKRLFF